MDIEQQYTKAFNHGFILAQFEPILLHTFTRNLAPVNNYLEGLFAGKEVFEIEKSKDHLFEIGKLRSQSIINDKDRGA
jgi:hypothetical protein